MRWKLIKGYKYPYRISETGIVEVYKNGSWQPIKARINSNRAVVNLRVKTGVQTRKAIVDLMADAFMGGKKSGYCIRHKDKSKYNNELRNLEQVPLNRCNELSKHDCRKPVEKIDRAGEVVEVYGSVQEAAKENYVSPIAVSRRCLNQLQDPFSLIGYSFQFADENHRRRRSKTK